MPIPTEQPCLKVGIYSSDCPHHIVHVVREIGEKFPDHAYPECEPVMWFHSDELDEQPLAHNSPTAPRIAVRTTIVFDESDFPFGPF